MPKVTSAYSYCRADRWHGPCGQLSQAPRQRPQLRSASPGDLVRTQTFTTDIDEFFKHVDVRMEYLGAALPTSTTVEVRRLSHPDFLVEIEAIAATEVG